MAVLPWSFSSLNAYETCPRRYYHVRVARDVKEPQTEALAWGNAVHKALEDAVNGRMLTGSFQAYQPLVDKLKTAPGRKHTERKFGLTSGYKSTTFFAKDVWFRGVIDLTVEQGSAVTILDYKTGKVREDGDQLKLFAAAGFAQYPQATTIRTGYVWLAHDRITRRDFQRDELPLIWQEFVPRIERMKESEAADKWLPNPSGLCRRHCPVPKSKCEFSGRDD